MFAIYKQNRDAENISLRKRGMMKRDIFQENYKGNALKVLFADLVVFLLVTILSVGFCYAYFSSKVEAMGSATTAMVTVAYRTNYSDITNRTTIYGSLNGGTAKEVSTTNISLTPGDNLTIKGYAVNTSNVPVYVLAKLEVTIKEDVLDGEDVTITETYWYNISNNQIIEQTSDGEFASSVTRYTLGASSLEDVNKTGYYQELSIPYTYSSKYTNLHTVTNIELTLHVHQKDYLRMGDDFSKYSIGEVDGKLGAYDTESIYAAHQITGRLLP